VIDSIKVCVGDKPIKGEKVQTGNVLNGMKVSTKDLVAFYYDPDTEEYKVYDYAAVKAADSVTALRTLKVTLDGGDTPSATPKDIYAGNVAYDYPKDDKVIKAILLEEDVIAAEDIIGLIASVDESQVSGGKFKATVTAYIDGDVERFTTVNYEEESELRAILNAPAEYRYYHPVKFIKKADGSLKAVKPLDGLELDSCALVSSFDGRDYAEYDWPSIYAKDKEDKLLRTSAEGDPEVWQPVGDAAFYYVDGDGELQIIKFNSINIANDPYGVFFQMDKDAESWSFVVIDDDDSAYIWSSTGE
jgi:hypothetical protein